MLAEFLRNRRKQGGFTLRQLADGLCSESYLSRIERGQSPPSPPLWLDLAERLLVPTSQAVEVYLESVEPTVPQLIQLGKHLAIHTHTTVARSVLLQAQQRMRGTSDPRPRRYRAELFEAYGVLHHQNGRVKASLNAFTASLNERRGVPSRPYWLARSYYQCGTVLLREGDDLAARSFLLQAFCLMQRINPATCPVDTAQVTQLHEWVVWALGVAMLHQGDVYGAWTIYQQARFVWDTYGILEHPAPALCSDMALAAIGIGKFETARELLQGVLTATNKQPELLVAAHNNLGLAYRLKGKLAQAREHQHKAWDLSRKNSYARSVPIALELAHLAMQEAKYSEAAGWLAQLSEEEVDDPAHRHEFRLLKARLARLSGDRATADQLLREITEAAYPTPVHGLLARLERVRLHCDDSDVVEAEVDAVAVLLARIQL